MIRLLEVGVSEDAIFSGIRTSGIYARPTWGEMNALRTIGATDRLLAWLLAAALLEPTECPPMPTIEFQFYLWQPYPALPGLVPIFGWAWLESPGQPLPRSDVLEP